MKTLYKKISLFFLNKLSVEDQKQIANRLLTEKDIEKLIINKFYFKGNLFNERFNQADLINTIKFVSQKYKTRNITILSDKNIHLPSEYSHVSIYGDINQINNFEDKFILAFESDQKLEKAVKKITALNGTYISIQKYLPTARYFHKNDLAKEILISQSRVQKEKFEVADYENIIQAIEITKDVPGDYVEIGVYKGGSAYTALSYLQAKKINRKSYFLDTFEGFNYSEAQKSSDALWSNTHGDTSISAVNEFLKDFSNYKLIKNNITTEDLPNEIGNISVCNIDVDLYEAIFESLKKVHKKISMGGIIILEDIGHTPALAGAHCAYMDFMSSEMSEGFIPIHFSSGQVFLIRIR